MMKCFGISAKSKNSGSTCEGDTTATYREEMRERRENFGGGSVIPPSAVMIPQSSVQKEILCTKSDLLSVVFYDSGPHSMPVQQTRSASC